MQIIRAGHSYCWIYSNTICYAIYRNIKYLLQSFIRQIFFFFFCITTLDQQGKGQTQIMIWSSWVSVQRPLWGPEGWKPIWKSKKKIKSAWRAKRLFKCQCLVWPFWVAVETWQDVWEESAAVAAAVRRRTSQQLSAAVERLLFWRRPLLIQQWANSKFG